MGKGNNTTIQGGNVGLTVSVQFETDSAVNNLKKALNKVGSFKVNIDTEQILKASEELQKIANMKLTLEGQAETLKYFASVTAELEKQLKMAVKIRENYERTGFNGKMSRAEYNSQQKLLYEEASKLVKSIVEDEKALLSLTGENKKQAQQILVGKREQLKAYQEQIDHENYAFTLSQKIQQSEADITNEKLRQKELEEATRAAQEKQLQSEKEAKTLQKIQETYQKILDLRVALYGMDQSDPRTQQIQGELKTLQQSMGGYKGKSKWSDVIANQERAMNTEYNLRTSAIDNKQLIAEQKAQNSLLNQANKYLDEYVNKSKVVSTLTGDQRKEGETQLKEMTKQLNAYEKMLTSTEKLNEFQQSRAIAEQKISSTQLQQAEALKQAETQAKEKAQKERTSANEKKEQEAHKTSVKNLEAAYKELYSLKHQLQKIDENDPSRETLENEAKRLSRVIGGYKGKAKYKETAIELEKKYQRELDITLAKEASKTYQANKDKTEKQQTNTLNSNLGTLTTEETRLEANLIKALAEEKRLKEDIQRIDIKDLELLSQENSKVGALATSLARVKAEKAAVLSTRESLGIEGNPSKEQANEEKAARSLTLQYEQALVKQNQIINNEANQNALLDARAIKQNQLNEKRVQALQTSILALENGKNAKFIDQERLTTLKAQLETIKQMSNVDLATHQLKLAGAELRDINSNANITRMRELGTSTHTLGQSFKNLAGYISGAMIIRRFWQEMKNGLEVIKEVDSTLTTLRITMTNFTEQDLNNLMNASKEMAVSLKTNFTDVMEVVKTVANETESLTTILAKSKPALILSNLTGLATSQTVEMIQGATKEFKGQFEDMCLSAEESAMKVADSMVSISRSLGRDFSTGISGMAEGIEIMGALAHELNMSLEETLALMASTAEQTRLTFSEIANAMKTTMARTIRISGTEEQISPEDLAKTEKALRGVGVQVRNLRTGEVRSFIDIMDDLAKIWDDLTDSLRGAIGDAMGEITAPLYGDI